MSALGSPSGLRAGHATSNSSGAGGGGAATAPPTLPLSTAASSGSGGSGASGDAYGRAVAEWEAYSARVAETAAAVADVNAANARVAAAYTKLGRSLSALAAAAPAEDARTPATLAGYVAAAEAYASTAASRSNDALSAALGTPLDAILRSHRELRGRIAARERLAADYTRAAAQFAVLQRKAARQSRKKRRQQDSTVAVSSTATATATTPAPSGSRLAWTAARSTLSAAAGRLGLGLGVPPATAPAAPPVLPSPSSNIPTPTLTGAPGSGTDLDESFEVDGGSATGSGGGGGGGGCSDSDSGDDSLPPAAAGGAASAVGVAHAPSRHAAAISAAAEQLSSFMATLAGVSEALADELDQSRRREGVVAANAVAAAASVHAAAGAAGAAAWARVPSTTVAAAADAGGSSASSTEAVAWWDEGAAARAAARTRAMAQRVAARRRLECAAVSRAVPLPITEPPPLPIVFGGEGTPAATSAATVLASPTWLAQVARFGTLREVAAIAGVCRATAAAVGNVPTVWLACVRAGGVDGCVHSAATAACSRPPLLGRASTQYLHTVDHAAAAFAAAAPVRYALWRRALGLDGRPVPRWSAAFTPGGAPPQRAVTPDEFAALETLAAAESAAGAKQDAAALADGDMVYDGSEGSDGGSGGAAARWAVTIGQDVLRSYVEGLPFGASPAVLRATRLHEAVADEGGGASEHDVGDGRPVSPTHLSMAAFLSAPDGAPSTGATAAAAAAAATPACPPPAESTPEVVEARRAALRSVLMATAASEPALRYTQGMASVARLLLELAMGARTDTPAGAPVAAFNMLGALLHVGTPGGVTHEPGAVVAGSAAAGGHAALAALFGHDANTLRLRLYQCRRLLVRHAPDLAAHLHREGVPPATYASSWLLTLFSNFAALPLPDVARLWDRFIIGGWGEVAEAFLAVMAAAAPELEGMPMEDLLRKLSAPLLCTPARTGAPSLPTRPLLPPTRDADLAAMESDFHDGPTPSAAAVFGDA